MTQENDPSQGAPDDSKPHGSQGRPSRRNLLRGAAAAAAAAAAGSRALAGEQESKSPGGDLRQVERGVIRAPKAAPPVLIGSANALPGMQQHYGRLAEGADPLDVAIDVVKIVEADPSDHSVGLGGLPDEDGQITLDAAVMHGPTHNSGAVACLRNILHPSEVARLVMERTDHCLIVDGGAYEFARSHGHPHTDLMTEETRRIWMQWKETMSDRDDRLAPRIPAEVKPQGSEGGDASETGAPKEAQDDGAHKKSAQTIRVGGEDVAIADVIWNRRITGTIHCSALAADGEIACTTTTSGLSWKIPGRVGDSPIVGAGLYCDQDVGSAGGTGRGESAVLANASFAVVEQMRRGASPAEALREVLRRVQRQALRASAWQPGLVGADGTPSFDLQLYCVNLAGETAGMSLKGRGSYAVADAQGGPRLERLVGIDH